MNQDTTSERLNVLDESINELQCINKKIAKLLIKKELLTADIIAAIGHDHEGQKSYDHGVWTVECKTPVTYSLNKKAYESEDIYLPDEFNPVKSSISYTIDKKKCEAYMATAPQEVVDTLVHLIEKKPSKPSVTIKDRK